MSECPRGDGRGERGQATLFMVVLVVIGVGLVWGIASAGTRAARAGRAQAVADATALAAVGNGVGTARRVAAENGGSIVSMRSSSEGIVEVKVRVGGATATSNAGPGAAPAPDAAGPTPGPALPEPGSGPPGP